MLVSQLTQVLCILKVPHKKKANLQKKLFVRKTEAKNLEFSQNDQLQPPEARAQNCHYPISVYTLETESNYTFLDQMYSTFLNLFNEILKHNVLTVQSAFLFIQG